VPFKSSPLFKPLQEALSPALPPYSEVTRVDGDEDELRVLVSVLTPSGMKPLLTVNLSMSQAGTSWAHPQGLRLQEPWFAHHWKLWESVQKEVSHLVSAVAMVVWAAS